MDFKKLGWYIASLGAIFGVAAGVFAWLPYDMRWEHFRAIVAATRGDTTDLFRIERQFDLYSQFKIGLGIASAVITFLGVAIISSSKPSVSESDASWTCPTCEVSNPTGHGCKLCGQPHGVNIEEKNERPNQRV